MLEVIYKNRSYDLFNSITVSRSLDNICGTFSLSTTLNTAIPFGRRSFIRIKADGVYIMSGYIEKMKGTITNDSANVVFSGRDLLGDLVDSSLPTEASVTEGSISLPSLCQKVIDSLGIPSKVRNLVGDLSPFDPEDVLAEEFGGKASVYLQSFARKRGVYLTSYGNGFLVLFTPPRRVAYRDKLTKDSMLSRNFDYSDVGRYNKVIVGAEGSFVTDSSIDPTDRSDKIAQATDPGVRSTRILIVNGEESMTDTEVETRAKEEINIRRGRAFKFTCTVPSHMYTIGTLVKVYDELSGISGTFLIKQVDYTQNENGNISTLTLCLPETYTAVSKRTSEGTSSISRPLGSRVGGMFGQDVEEPLLQ